MIIILGLTIFSNILGSVLPIAKPDIALASSIGPVYLGLPTSKAPCLEDKTEGIACSQYRLGAFALTSTYGMGRLYENILKVLNGNHIAGLPSPKILKNLLENNRGISRDKIIGSEIDFAGGFMLELESLGFPSLSKKAFGQSALSGAICMFADPEKDLSAAIHLNGTGRGPSDFRYLSETLIYAVLDDYENLNQPIKLNEMRIAV